MLPILRSNGLERRVLALPLFHVYRESVRGGPTTQAIAQVPGQPRKLHVRIAISDDLFRVGLARLLADEGIDAGPGPAADAVLFDMADGKPDDLSGGCTVAMCGPGEDEVVEALLAGASAVVSRASDPAVIAAALRTATAGAVVMPAGTASRLFEARQQPAAADTGERRAIDSLSEREREVLALVAAGLANEEIADALVVTASTVKNHLARIMAKLGARNRTHAAVISARAAA
jgi:DNA-binding CsgD family transcriptional regulator